MKQSLLWVACGLPTPRPLPPPPNFNVHVSLASCPATLILGAGAAGARMRPIRFPCSHLVLGTDRFAPDISDQCCLIESANRIKTAIAPTFLSGQQGSSCQLFCTMCE